MPLMPPQTKRLLIAALIMATASRARADVIIHDIGNNAGLTLRDLGADFVYGCAVLAIGLMVSVFLYRRK